MKFFKEKGYIRLLKEKGIVCPKAMNIVFPRLGVCPNGKKAGQKKKINEYYIKRA